MRIGVEMVAEVAIESDGKFPSAITILSPWPALAKACSKSGEMQFGIPISGIWKNYFIYNNGRLQRCLFVVQNGL